ncbi:MAG: pitrilysin family protein [Thermodesulfovibrionia bacterium]|nr:pitrilysin family protein [Thermodesulfovibrionia bacterium]
MANGLRVIMVPVRGTEAITLLALFGVGSRYENIKLNGAAHFIEHMMFKGTQKRPTTMDISRPLDRIGADYNAFTAKDHTGYWITTVGKHFPLVSDVLFDMLLHSKFEATEVERERQVILEEIKMYQENPLMHIDDLFDSLIFAGHPLGWNIAGTKETMAGIGQKELLNFKNDFYNPRNAVVVVAGKLNKKVFSRINQGAQKFSGAGGKKQPLVFKFTKTKPVILHHQKVDQAQLALGFPAYHFKHKSLPALRLLNIILGGNMSSRLFIEVRERRGLAYFVRSEIDSFSDIGSWKVRAGLDVSRIEEAVRVIMGELAKIRLGVTEKELKDAKEFIRGKTVLSLEESAAQAEWCAKQELLMGKIFTPKEKMAEMDKVTLKDVKMVANELIKKEKLRCAVIGPWKDNNKFIKSVKL